MRRAAALLGVLALSGCTRLFFFPDGHVYQRPEALNLAFDTPTFPSLDGTHITGIFFQSKTKPAKGTVVHLHGNAGNITSHWNGSAWLTGYGFNVFVLDYRGYGASDGRPSEKGCVEDARAALAYVRSRPDVDPGKIVVLGQSLGGAIAPAAVADSTAGVRALALDSPFASYRGIARDKLSGSWLGRLLKWPLSLLVSDREKPLNAVSRLPPIPILVMSAPGDPVVPYGQAQQVYNAAKQPKTFWVIPGQEHTAALGRYGAVYRPMLAEFFEQALRGSETAKGPE